MYIISRKINDGSNFSMVHNPKIDGPIELYKQDSDYTVTKIKNAKIKPALLNETKSNNRKNTKVRRQ